MFQNILFGSLRAARKISDDVGSPALAFVPAATLGAYWVAGETALVGTALGLPLLMMLGGYLPRIPHGFEKPVEQRSLDSVPRLETALDQAVTHFVNGAKNAVCIDMNVEPKPNPRQAEALGHRLKGALRFGDIVAQRGDHTFTACIQASDNLTEDAAYEIAVRLQTALSRSVLAGGVSQTFQATLGYCTSKNAPDLTASSLLDAATRAALAAKRQGKGGLRAYEPSMGGQTLKSTLVQGVAEALKNGEIHPWFQPQFDTQTGDLSGVEALVRWLHPEHGLIPPNEFLSAVRQAGAWTELTDMMINKSLEALAYLDSCGIHVPTVGVNFAQEDLSDHRLPDRIAWALDRTDLQAPRLTIEVLESVVAGGTDSRVQDTLKEVAKIGCQIDLDDFGTGHASIACLRDYSLHRLKIDRSYVENIDKDERQRAMLETILMMAKRLGFDTLAEGIETQSQLQVLTKLGCGHVQGFGLAKPMPLMDLELWWADRTQSHKREVAPQ